MKDFVVFYLFPYACFLAGMAVMYWALNGHINDLKKTGNTYRQLLQQSIDAGMELIEDFEKIKR